MRNQQSYVNKHNREEWNGGPPVQAEIIGYTDSSKTNDGR